MKGFRQNISVNLIRSFLLVCVLTSCSDSSPGIDTQDPSAAPNPDPIENLSSSDLENSNGTQSTNDNQSTDDTQSTNDNQSTGNTQSTNDNQSTGNTQSTNDNQGTGNTQTTSEPSNSNQSQQNSINTAPRIEAPSTLNLSYSGAPKEIRLQVTDADNNAVRVSWAIDSGPRLGDLVLIPSSDFMVAKLSATVVGDYEIIALATDGISSTEKSITVSVTNAPPVAPSISIQQNKLDANSNAIANHLDPRDADNDNLNIEYYWNIYSIGGAHVVTTVLPELPLTHFKRDDRLSVSMFITDGSNSIRTNSEEVVVTNAAPRVNAASLGPVDAKASDDVVVNIVDMKDADGDQLDTSFQWYSNNILLAGQNNSTLPAGVTHPTDIIKAVITVSDGIDSVTLSSNELTILDTPSYLVVEPTAPIVMDYGLPYSFTAKFVDDDGEQVQTELTKAPDGLTYDPASATVSWTPLPVIFTRQQSYSAQFTSSDGQIDSVEFTVNNDQATLLLAKGGIPIPRRNFQLDVGDFDADGTNEVLSTDSRSHIFTLEFDGKSIEQDWMYPFSIQPGEDIIRLWGFGENLSQVLVVTTNGVSLIESRTALPTRILDTTYDIVGTELADIDNDGTDDLLLVSAEGELSKLNTEDWTLASFGKILTVLDWSGDFYTLALGNLDDDLALEIVVSTGQVVDGATGEIEWAHSAPFGSLITLGDVTGDGNPDIVASNRWDNVTSYDPVAKTSIWSYNINDFCSLLLHNVDEDPQDELIAGPCQHGSVEIYDGSSGTMVLQNDIDHPEYNSALRSYSLGDLDHDGVDDLIFSTGSGSSAEDNMAVLSLGSLNENTANVVVNYNPAQLGEFKFIGWDTTTTTQERAVFVMPDTEGGGDDGARIGLLSLDGEFKISDSIAYNWGSLATGFVTDTNGDDIAEALIGVGNPYDGELHHYTLNDFTEVHIHTALSETAVSFGPEINSIALGIDSDASPKAIITTDNNTFQIYDITSMQADWTSGGLSGGGIRDAIAIDNSSGFDIAVATRTEVTLWEKSENTYTKSTSAAIECDHLAYLNLKAVDQIACVTTDVFGDNSTITFFNTALVKQSELTFDHGITTISNDPQGDLLIATATERFAFGATGDNRLRRINPSDGEILWESPSLIGEINQISFLDSTEIGNTIMALSTSKSMYIMEY